MRTGSNVLAGVKVGFDHLTKEGMLEGLSAPLHPGALQYFKETGLIK